MSPVKWLGGKTTILPKLRRYMKKEGSCLIEPFVGSAAVSLNTNYDHYILNDTNADLIGMYKEMVKDPDAFLKDAFELFDKFNTSVQYYELRAHFNSLPPCRERYLIFLYLNRHGYKGLVRYSKATGFNVPWGDYKKPYFPEKEIRFFAEKFKSADFTSICFKELLSQRMAAMDDTVVFADPPYVPLSSTAKFVGYTEDGFDLCLHQELDELMAKFVQSVKGGKAYLTNHDAFILEQLYAGYEKKIKLRVKRSISAKAKKHKKAPEVILVY